MLWDMIFYLNFIYTNNDYFMKYFNIDLLMVIPFISKNIYKLSIFEKKLIKYFIEIKSRFPLYQGKEISVAENSF